MLYNFSVDLTCMNYAGNILDVSVKAMTSALKNVKVPEAKIITQPPTESDLEVPPKLEISTEESSKRPLKLGSMPLSHTVCLFEDNLLLGKYVVLMSKYANRF